MMKFIYIRHLFSFNITVEYWISALIIGLEVLYRYFKTSQILFVPGQGSELLLSAVTTVTGSNCFIRS